MYGERLDRAMVFYRQLAITDECLTYRLRHADSPQSAPLVRLSDLTAMGSELCSSDAVFRPWNTLEA